MESRLGGACPGGGVLVGAATLERPGIAARSTLGQHRFGDVDVAYVEIPQQPPLDVPVGFTRVRGQFNEHASAEELAKVSPRILGESIGCLLFVRQLGSIDPQQPHPAEIDPADRLHAHGVPVDHRDDLNRHRRRPGRLI